MVNLVINDQESVVSFVKRFDFYEGILGVVPSNIKLELRRYLLCVDGCRNTSLPFVQHCQYGIIHVIVDEDDVGLGILDQSADKLICVVNLAVEKDALTGRN